MRFYVLFSVAFLQLSCSVNVLENFAVKDSDEAKYIEAKKLMNKGDYDATIDMISEMSTSFQSQRRVITLSASAYAGRCGLELLPFTEAFGDMGTKRLFPFLSDYFATAAPTKWADCVTAENLLESLGTTSQRTTDENVFMLLISFAKIGNILSFYTDSDNNGSPDAGYSAAACGTSGSQTADGALTDADQREVGTGITLAISALTALSGTIDLGSGTLDSVTSACGSLPAQYNFCSITDPASFTADHLRLIRSFIREDSTIGVGSCAGDVSACLCP